MELSEPSTSETEEIKALAPPHGWRYSQINTREAQNRGPVDRNRPIAEIEEAYQDHDRLLNHEKQDTEKNE